MCSSQLTITVNSKVVATAKTCHFKVVNELTEITFEMFSDYIQSGDLNKTCEFLNTANLIKGEKGFKFQDILWLLKDKKVFGRITEILRNRYIYNNDVWSYGFKHNDLGVIKEFLLKNRVSAGSKKLEFTFNELNSSGEQSRKSFNTQ